jgi:type II secretory pathway component GspD/PulD (secretin)
MKILMILAVSILPSSVLAATWKEKCPNLTGCVETMSQLTNQRYVLAPDLSEAKMSFSSNFTVANEDAELVFTTLLDQNGLSRLRLKDGTFLILRSNDAKGKDVPLFKGDLKNAPELPDTYDLVTLEYHFANPEMAKPAENVIRTYANMGARIYGADIAGILFITDTARGVRKTYQLLKSLDVKPAAKGDKK